MSKPNGRLRQLTSAKESPWIGWGIIGVLLTMVAFFGVGWIKNIELKITEQERENKQMQLQIQSEKARIDALQVTAQTLVGTNDRISEYLRAIDNRLIRMELGGQRRTVQ